MEENITEKKADQLITKKEYTPATLVVYGSFTQLTASGTTDKNESTGQPLNSPKP